MRLTPFADYELRTLMRFFGTPEQLLTTSERAAQSGISRNHLAKVVRNLSTAGYIENQCGSDGEFQLAVGVPQSITFGRRYLFPRTAPCPVRNLFRALTCVNIGLGI